MPPLRKAYVTRNVWHSCVVVPLESHFVGKPRSRELCDGLREARNVGDQLTEASRA